MSSSAAAVGHPSPHHERVGVGRLMLGVAGGPAAWSVQLLANFGHASLLCFAHAEPSLGRPASWPTPWIWLFAVNVLALVIAAVCAAVSYGSWTATRSERPGASGHLLEIGEGRSRFLALVGMLASAGFFAAVLFDTIALAVVPPCYE